MANGCLGTGPESEENTNLDPLKEKALIVLHEHVRQLMSNHRFSKALDALRKMQNDVPRGLLAQGVDVMPLVPVLAAIAVFPSGVKQETREKLWTLETGKSWKSLKEFPDRLRGMADEVEQLNRSSFFAPERAIMGKTRLTDIAKQRLQGLPAIIRLYAAWLGSWSEMLPALSKPVLPLASHGHSPYIVHLSKFVKATTGRFLDRQVAELLSAATIVLTPGSDNGYDAQTIADLRSRQKHKNPKT